MRLTVKYAVFILSIFVFASCSNSNNPVSSGTQSNLTDNSGLVVDNLSYRIELKKGLDGNYSDYFVYKIDYHFVNSNGSLNYIAVVPEGAPSYMMIAGGAARAEIGKTLSVESDYSLGKIYEQGQKLKVKLMLEGNISKNSGIESTNSGNFKIQKSIDVTI